MTLPIQTLPNRDALMRAAADRLQAALRTAIATRGSACAALSGGTTPAPAYEILAAAALDWPRVTFALVDERFAPPDHEASNEALLRRTLAPALANGAKLAPMWSKAANASEAAARADAAYAAFHIDIALMGMGADGHTASWFPGAAGLHEALEPQSQRAVVALHAPQAAGAADRLSLTLPAIVRAERALLVITGADKRERLESALRQTPETAPVVALAYAMADRLQILWAE